MRFWLYSQLTCHSVLQFCWGSYPRRIDHLVGKTEHRHQKKKWSQHPLRDTYTQETRDPGKEGSWDWRKQKRKVPLRCWNLSDLWKRVGLEMVVRKQRLERRDGEKIRGKALSCWVDNESKILTSSIPCQPLMNPSASPVSFTSRTSAMPPLLSIHTATP